MSNTQQTLAQMIRAKYPDSYKDMSDTALESAILAKHPEYGDLPRTQAKPEGFTDFLARTQEHGAYLSMSPTGIATSPDIPAKTQAEVIGSSFGAEAGLGVKGLAGMLVRMFGSGAGAATGNVAGQAAETGHVNPSEALKSGAGFALGEGAGEVVGSGIKAIGETKRAGAAFEQISKAIGTKPVAVTDDLSTSLNALRKSNLTTNTSLPPVVKKLIDRLDPMQGAGPLTYDEARAFYSEISNLAASDKMAMTSNTSRMVNGLKHSLGDTIQDTADLADQGNQLSKAMGDYHHAMQVKRISDTVKEEFWKAVLTGAGIYGARKIWESAAP